MPTCVIMNHKERYLSAFASHLTKLRTEKNYSIRELASRSNLEYSQVQRIEKGKVNFSFITLIALADGLELNLSDLLQNFNTASI